MVFGTGAALLDAIVLAVVASGHYGYKITQDVQAFSTFPNPLFIHIAETAEDDCLEVYDMAYAKEETEIL